MTYTDSNLRYRSYSRSNSTIQIISTFSVRSNMEREQNTLLPLSSTGDLAQNWQEWKNNFIRYLTKNNYIKTSEDLKIRKLKEYIGPLGIYFIDIVTKDCKLNNLQILLAKLDSKLNLVSLSEVEARYNFFTCSREKDEYIDKYIDRLKEKAKVCNFRNMMENLIRDKVITDIKDKDLLLKLFHMKFLDLSTLSKICCEYEMAERNRKKAEKDKTAKQGEKAKKTEKVEKEHLTTKTAKIDNRSDGSNINKTDSQIKFNRNCWKCNTRHPIRCCPAFGHKCEKCGDRNHFTICCNMKISNDANKKPSYESPNNTRKAYDFSCSTPSNMNPSAPPAFEEDNTLYPNLRYL